MLDLDTLVADGLLICPRCSSVVRPGDDGWRCINTSCGLADKPFPVVSGAPALVDFERSVVSAEHLRAHDGGSAIERQQKPGLLRRLLHPANEQAPRNATRMLELLRRDGSGRRPRVLVIGGGTVGDGLEELYADPGIDLVAFDVYASPHTQFVADGHRIPMADESMDGVVIQAVLEHVLEPTVVVAEIHRVLRKGGVVYADTPFLQQVHEGPYDFTRFTDSGHRFLFRGFERIDSGAVAGAGTALRWSVDHFVRALTRSVPLGRIVALAFFWLSWTDRFLDPKHSVDAASSVYFLGRKSDREISGAEIIDYYQGGM
jgi:SAM-dependent methyltransferase